MTEEIRRLAQPTTINGLAEHWINDYRANRYLAKLSRKELDDRTADIASNMLRLDDDGKYRPRFRIRPDRIYASIRGLDFLRMATDVWEEARLRGYGKRDKLSDRERVQIAKRTAENLWCRRRDWVEASRLSLESYENPRMLFRFSKTKWNEDFMRRGRIRVCPASYYSAHVGNNAIKDDELRLHWYDQEKRNPQFAEVSDYFVICMSSEYDYRLFADFEANSCVAIRDPSAFSDLLHQAVLQHNKVHRHPRISIRLECSVIYVDPFLLLAPELVTEVYFCKHFRFAYQTEFRFVLIPTVQQPLQPFFLELGSLESIVEIVSAPKNAASKDYEE